MNDLGTDESGRMNTVSIHTTLVPYIAAAGELKTKPTQHSVRDLTSLGIQPDLLLCRVDRPLPDGERAKIAQFCNVRKEAVIPALDAKRSEEHTSELQSLMRISYAVFCLKKKKHKTTIK